MGSDICSPRGRCTGIPPSIAHFIARRSAHAPPSVVLPTRSVGTISAPIDAMAYRMFRDTRGTEWYVWEVHPHVPIPSRDSAETSSRAEPPAPPAQHASKLQPLLPGALANGWLCFQSETERRRLAPVPPDWGEASEEQLAMLCTQAAPARLTRRVTE
jgi:hypothetical protein